MNNQVQSPPTWASTILYLFIIIVLFICVLTFILKASCLFTEPSLHMISYSIVTFSVGLSLICCILWIGGVTGITEITSTTQKILWVTLIAGILSTTVTVYKGFITTAKIYKVTGIVEKMDGKDPRDVSIYTRFPPLSPAQLVRENLAFDVWEDPKGKLPRLLFSHPDYSTENVDLNDREIVELKNGELNILSPIKLKKSSKSEG